MNIAQEELREWHKALRSPSGRKVTRKLFGDEFAGSFYKRIKTTLKKGA